MRYNHYDHYDRYYRHHRHYRSWHPGCGCDHGYGYYYGCCGSYGDYHRYWH